MSKLSGSVRITGVINDDEFWAEGEAVGDPESGEYTVRLEYERVPRGWDPLLYTDVKVSLLFHREEQEGRNLLSVTGGSYRTSGSIDLGNGNLLRNNTMIEMVDDETFRAVYVMYGTAQTGKLQDIEFFEETMIPFGKGKIAALALARWKTTDGKDLDAIFSTKYVLSNEEAALEGAQFRRMEAHPTFDGRTFQCSYNGYIQNLPRFVEKKGAYIGHLIG